MYDPSIPYDQVVAAKFKAAKVADQYTPEDRDGDGVITKYDCPFPFGSPQAKIWWDQVVEPYVKTQITPGMKAQYGDAVTGAYKGKPLVPNQIGPGQGDFEFLVDKLQVKEHLSAEAALKIALKAKEMKYG